MNARRWLALCGVIGALLIPIAIFAVDPIDSTASTSATEVMSLYHGDHTAGIVAAVMVALGGLLIACFGARLRDVLAGGETGSGSFPMIAFGGGLIAAAGCQVAAIVHVALEEAVNHGFATAAQTLNILDGDMFFILFSGLALMLVGAGIATVRRAVLPRWLGWSAIAIAILTLAGPIGFLGFLLALLWIVVVGILMIVRDDAGDGSIATTELFVETLTQPIG